MPTTTETKKNIINKNQNKNKNTKTNFVLKLNRKWYHLIASPNRKNYRTTLSQKNTTVLQHIIVES